MKTRSIIWIFVLIIVDQIIKVVILNSFIDVQFEIIPSLVEFKPNFNEKHSWVNVLLNEHFGLHVGLFPHIILYLIIGILIPMFFLNFRNEINNNKKLIEASLCFLMAALFCALAGNLIWNEGTLDYIAFNNWFVFDLKDVYVDIGIGLFLVYSLINRKQIETINSNKYYRFHKQAKN